VQERNVTGVDASLQALNPVVLLDIATHDALLWWDQHPLWPRQRRAFFIRPHIDPDNATGFLGGIRRRWNFMLEVRLGGLVWHVDAGAVDVELPAVIDAEQSCFLVPSEEQRCGQLFCRIPTLPLVSRNAMSCSSSSGSLSDTGSSVEISAGNQKRRKSVPIGVPGPIRHRYWFSA
jgi:hypothetical protein